MICVLLRSCRARDEPFLIDTPERIYEENVTVENIYDVILTIKGDAGIGLYNCCFESKL
ncbi:MAG: hypothetical protein MR508_01725 [Lachnospiraceae bacterium]|nr:hypothetical protein [Lachnospiraceae bacterium]